MDTRLTIFTPTYNRVRLIGHLYESLKRQTACCFEWLVIDDGSTDGTEAQFQKWIAEDNPFSIRYYKKENGGKCRAINDALDLAQGDLFFVVDSDDYLTDDAIEKVLKWKSTLPENGKFCGVVGNLGTDRTTTPNTCFDSEFYDGTLLDRYNQIDGERAIVFDTQIHKKYRYPEYAGETFMTEAVVYNRMANDGYKIRFYNDIICVYAYQEDGLTKAGTSLFLNNPRGYGLWLKEKANYRHETLKEKMKMYYNFSCELSGKYDVKTISACIDVPSIVVRLSLVIHRMTSAMKKNRHR